MTTADVSTSPTMGSMDSITMNVSCNYFKSQFNSTISPDICDIVVFAGGGVVLLLLFVGILLFCIFCCSKRSRGRNHQGTVQRTKPLVTTQATSWFTNSLTSKNPMLKL